MPEFVCRVATPSGEVFDKVYAGSDERSLRRELEDQELMILDVMMEHLSAGFDLANRLRGGVRQRRIPVIFLSSVETVFDVTTQVDESWLPCDTFLRKPVDEHLLLAAVRDVLAQAESDGRQESGGSSFPTQGQGKAHLRG